MPIPSHWPEVALREALVRGLFFLPSSRRTSLERWLRGREEYRLLRACDVAVVSYGKSGRTWLRLMLSRFYQRRHGLPEGSFLEFENLHRHASEIPRVFFTHGNYLRDYTGHFESKQDFRDRRVLLLVRDPRDVAVSQYFQWARRMRPRKKRINAYPPHGADLSLRDFVLEHEAGLERVLEFLRLWARDLPGLGAARVVRYEDLREDPARELSRILEFFGTPGTPDAVRDAVDYASVDNMRRLEREGGVRASGQRLVPGRRDDPDSYKVRRAVVGGWRDYFDEADRATIDARVAAALGPAFGYGATPDPPDAGAARVAADAAALRGRPGAW